MDTRWRRLWTKQNPDPTASPMEAGAGLEQVRAVFQPPTPISCELRLREAEKTAEAMA